MKPADRNDLLLVTLFVLLTFSVLVFLVAETQA